jgi:tetratricopeptide (TPR) repeat protein
MGISHMPGVRYRGGKAFRYAPCTLAILVVLLSWPILSAPAEKAGSSPTVASEEHSAAASSRILLNLALGGEKQSLSEAQILSSSRARGDSPMWPVVGLLTGELLRASGESARARLAYRELAEWAVNDPYRDGWGGTGLVSLALWRWTQMLGDLPNPDLDEIRTLLELTSKLKDARLPRKMSEPFILGSLPQLDEELKGHLPLLAWRSGIKTEAVVFFLSSLTTICPLKWGQSENDMVEEAVSSGLITRDRLTLLHGRCLASRGRNEEAMAHLRNALQGQDQQVRIEAALALAKLKLKSADTAEKHNEALALLNIVLEEAKDADLVQAALYERALLYQRSGPLRNPEQFRNTLLELVRRFPAGKFSDDALYQLALHYEENGDLTQALLYYDKLRAFSGPNDWSNFAAFKPAMALYTRAQPGDHPKAVELLHALEARNPFGPLHFAALFWIGRIAEESGNADQARSYFERIIQEGPYDYYAVRSRMHQHLSRNAAKELWPDVETRRALQTVYQDTPHGFSLEGESPYQLRVREALANRLYHQVFTENHRLRLLFPSQRLEDLSLRELDRTNLLTPLCLLLALRQDVLAANDAVPDPANRIQLAGAVGLQGGDWPLTMKLITASDEPLEVRAAAQRNSHYLAAAYPVVFREPIAKYSAQYDVPPELVYAVMRNESLFNPDALSPRSALGLFQFIPSTFEVLDRRWNLTAKSKAAARESFLLNPDCNIEMGARWFKEELLTRNKGSIPFAVMEHNAGYPAVRRWTEKWRAQGRDDDLEYMLETIPYLETRIFARRVLSDMAMVSAMQIFSKEASKK